MNDHPGVLVPLEANPLEAYLLGLCALSGATGMIELLARGHTLDGTPYPIAAAWFVLLTLGGGAGLFGAFWRDRLTGILVLRTALWFVSAGALMYALVLPGRAGWLQAGIVAVFGLAAGWRTRQISRYLRTAWTTTTPPSGGEQP